MDKSYRKVLLLGVCLSLAALNAADDDGSRPGFRQSDHGSDSVARVVVDAAEVERLRAQAARVAMYKERAERLEAQRALEAQQRTQQQGAVASGRCLNDDAEERRQHGALMIEYIAGIKSSLRQVEAQKADILRDAVEATEMRSRMIEFFTQPLFSSLGVHLETLKAGFAYWEDKFSRDIPFDVWVEEIVPPSSLLKDLLAQFREMHDTLLARDFYGFVLFNKIFKMEQERGGAAFDFFIDVTSLEVFIAHYKDLAPALADTDYALTLFSELALFTGQDRLVTQLSHWSAFKTWAIANEGMFTDDASLITSTTECMKFIQNNDEQYNNWFSRIRNKKIAEDAQAQLEREDRRRVQDQEVHEQLQQLITTLMAEGATREEAEANANQILGLAPVVEHAVAAARADDDEGVVDLIDDAFGQRVEQLIASTGCDKATAERLVREGVRLEGSRHVAQRAAAVVVAFECRVQEIMGILECDRKTAEEAARAEA